MMSGILLAAAAAYPSAYGASGYYLLMTPQPMERYENRASLSVGGFLSYSTFTLGGPTGRGNEQVFAIGNAGVAYTPSNFYDLYMMLRGREWWPDAGDDGIGGVSDADLGLKFRFLDLGILAMGTDLAVTLPTGETQTQALPLGPDTTLDVWTMSGQVYKFRGQLLTELDFSRRNDIWAFRLVGNFGYYYNDYDVRFDNVLGSSVGDTVATPLLVGGGFVISSRYLDYIIEARYHGPTDFSDPLVVSPLIRLRPFEDFGLSIAGGINVYSHYLGLMSTDYSEWNYDVLAGIGLVTPVFRTEELKPGGQLFGKVYDAKTKEPLQGKVRIVEANINLNTDSTGIYRVRHLPVGIYTLIAESEGYRKAYNLVNIKKRSSNVVDIPMDPAVVLLKGIVIDSLTSKPVDGTKLAFTGPENESLTTGDEEFSLKLKPGSYWVTAEREGYRKKSVDLSLFEQKFLKIVLGRPLVLEPKLIKTVNFATASANLSKKAEAELEAVAKQMMADPLSKIIIRGHADRHGSVFYNELLSEKRARAVKDYLVKRYDVAADRISYEWYSEFQRVRKSDRASRRADIYLLEPAEAPESKAPEGKSEGEQEEQKAPPEK